MKGQHQKGAAAIEFALILPALILLLFGTLEVSLLLFNEQVITNAGREGARYGIVFKAPRYTDAEIRAVVIAYCTGHLITFGAAGDPGIVIGRTGTGSSFGDDLTVTVTYNYDFLVLANFGFGPVTLTAKTVMKSE